MGTAEDAAKKYDVDEVKYSDEVNDVLSSFASANASATVYAIENQIDASVKIDVFKSKDLKEVKKAIEEARVIKDEYEIAMIRKANQISGWAHKAVTKRAKTVRTRASSRLPLWKSASPTTQRRWRTTQSWQLGGQRLRSTTSTTASPLETS